ncbi:hypothetical protein OUZ56_021371 [Daphnia magna]|uniref:Uncharacterized protein n=1 Tax=Daphnia magna TaxID=35525 RepID=A0ABQ9ZH60_9CRUS|nr:hypothetical protein OUZ56_021371 [Daphnia magna]
MKSLTDFVANQRERFDDFENEALKLITNGKYRDADKIPRRRRQQVNDGPSEDVVLSGQTRFRVDGFLPILDSLSQAQISRTNAYSKIAGLSLRFKKINLRNCYLAGCRILGSEFAFVCVTLQLSMHCSQCRRLSKHAARTETMEKKVTQRRQDT